MTQELTLTEYMNKSLSFRNKLTKYCMSKGNKAQETRKTLHLLDVIDNASEKDAGLRMRFYTWMLGGTSTIELREIAKEMGYDYWSNIQHQNIVDTFDSVQSYI